MKTTVALEYRANEDSTQSYVIFPECEGCTTCFGTSDPSNEKQASIQEAFEGWISAMVETKGSHSVARFNSNVSFAVGVPKESDGVLVAVWAVKV